MINLLSVAYLAAFVLVGLSISRLLLHSERPLVRMWLGCVFALVLLLWLPALFSFALGFTLLSQLLALVCAVAIGTACRLIGRAQQTVPLKSQWLEERGVLITLLPLFVIGLILFSTHTIPERGGALWTGQSTQGDLPMHLGFITSIAEQRTFPPMYSICPDTPVGYPFLSDSISSTFYVLGASLRFATLLPAVYASLLVLVGVYLFFERWLTDRAIARFAALLFFLGGGFGFAYFFDLLKLNPDNLSRIFTAFYETPTNYTVSGVAWVNPIADMLIPQRATLFGWSLLFPCLYLLYRGAFEREARLFPLLGVIAGALPLVHTHSFLALGVISAVYLVRSLLRREGWTQLLGYLKYALVVAILASPQLLLFTFRQSGSFLHLHWNWVNSTDNFFWFYIKNMGLLFLLLPVAFFSADRRDRGVFGGVLVLWLLAELVQFQPNPYDNNKLLFVAFAFLCGLDAQWMVRAYRRLRLTERRRAVGTRVLAGIVCVALFLSGSLTLVREYLSAYQSFGASEVSASDFIMENTAPDATFLTDRNHNNSVAALTGRNIVCGSSSYLYFHGVDYYDREAAIQLLYEEPSVYFDSLAAQYGIDYVFVGNSERYTYDCDMDYFYAHFKLIYGNESVMIFDVSQAP